MIQQVFILFHGSAFPIVLLMIFAQKPDTRLGLMQTFEDLFKSSVNDKSLEDDVLPVNYQMGIPEVQYSSHTVCMQHTQICLQMQKYCSLF